MRLGINSTTSDYNNNKKPQNSNKNPQCNYNNQQRGRDRGRGRGQGRVQYNSNNNNRYNRNNNQPNANLAQQVRDLANKFAVPLQNAEQPQKPQTRHKHNKKIKTLRKYTSPTNRN